MSNTAPPTADGPIRPRKQRRILSIDGGGVRGTVGIEILCAMEQALRDWTGKRDVVLGDYFDLVAGTSVGAIIAASLALGKSMEEARAFFLDNVGTLFRRRAPYRVFSSLYDARHLTEKLQGFYGIDTTLGASRLKTLVMLVLQNVSTDSPWIVTNNPRAKFNDRTLDDCNLNLLLWEVARASAAAPFFFEAEEIEFGKAKPYTFVFSDGALTTLNNPAYKAFSIATLPPYGLEWPVGEDKILLISVGVGSRVAEKLSLTSRQINTFWAATQTTGAVLISAEQEQDILCRTYGRCRTGGVVDSELGDMTGMTGPIEPRLFTYHRLNVALNQRSLAAINCSHLYDDHLRALDKVKFVPAYRDIGRALAAKYVTPRLFEGFPLEP
jgi:hypothetical protein